MEGLKECGNMRFHKPAFATVKLYSMPTHSPRASGCVRAATRATLKRQLAALCLTMLLGACSGISVSSLWPFGSDSLQGREPGPPPNAVAYRCDGNRSFYLRMLESGAAWVILPDREFRLDRNAGTPGRFGNGVAVLDLKDDAATLSEGAGQNFTGCRVPKPEAAKG